MTPIFLESSINGAQLRIRRYEVHAEISQRLQSGSGHGRCGGHHIIAPALLHSLWLSPGFAKGCG